MGPKWSDRVPNWSQRVLKGQIGSQIVLVNLYLESVVERSIMFIHEKYEIPKAQQRSDLISLRGPAFLESE